MAGITTELYLTKVENVISRYKKGDLVIPQYQRRYQYKEVNKMNLINSLIIGISIDSITCCKHQDKYYLCDGMHRLLSLVSFINDEYPYRYSLEGSTAKDLKIDIELNGKKFSEFPKELQTDILKRDFNMVVVESKEPTISVNSLVNTLMIAKNSCALPVNKARLDLNRKFVSDPSLVIPWSNLLNGVKSSVSPTMLSRVLNKSSISSTFDLLSKHYTQVQMESIINRVLKINLMQVKNEQTLTSMLQGALIYSALKEDKSDVVWNDFLLIWVKVKRFNNAGDTNLTVNSLYRTLMILYSGEVTDNFKVSRAIKVALQKLCLDSEVPDNLKDKVSLYI
jgi:hypothetical protein